MTKKEASERYHIPMEVLDEYESMGLWDKEKKKTGTRTYGDTDLARLSMMMTLREIGFDNREIESYLRLMLEGEGTERECLKMLNAKRSDTLDEIHWKEKQLDRLDYLRFQMKTVK